MSLRVRGTALSSTLSRERVARGDLALLIDFGSTFTKVAAVDLARSRLIGRAQSPSTIATDVAEGLLRAIGDLHDRHLLFESRPERIEDLDGVFVRACSSAAGGLRIAVVGNVPGLTAQAANTAALGAGAKVVGVHAFRLGDTAFEAIRLQRPDMILLAGGTDGGDETTIRHNARALARADLSVPVVVAGNCDMAGEIEEILTASGIETRIVGNVMPKGGVLDAEPARSAIRDLFMRRITDAKGLEQIKARIPVVLPTPMAVQRAVTLGSQGLGERSGVGDLVVVDIGGATTDVYSVGSGTAREKSLVLPSGLAEPFSKRTVEGDLGLRWNAQTIVQQVGRERFRSEFLRLAPEHDVSDGVLLDYVEHIGADTSIVPEHRWQSAVDALLARKAADLAIARHVGTLEPYYSPEGVVQVQAGKDMTDARLVIGTGGIFTSNPYAERILADGERGTSRRQVLRPANPRILLDRSYVLYAIGLLAEDHPEAALAVFGAHFGNAERGERIAAWACNERDAMTGMHPVDCDCCS